MTYSIEHNPEMIHVIKPIIGLKTKDVNIKRKRLPDPMFMGII
jgi:hypothetical protein